MVNTLKKTNKKGFTLVELVIVIAILAILAAIAIPTVSNVIGTANTNTDAANCQTIELALKSAHAEATAGTWTSVSPDTITVADALKHEGLDYTTLKNGIKTGTAKTFYYASAAVAGDTTASGKIAVISVSGLGKPNIELSSNTKVSDYIAGVETK